MKFSTLTVELSRDLEGPACKVAYRLVRPDSMAREDLGEDEIVLPTAIPRLDRRENLAAYVQALSTAVFGGKCGAVALATAKSAAVTAVVPLRVRVSAGLDDQLAAHHWELLADPEDNFAPLAWGEQSCFSRYLDGKVRVTARPAVRVRSIAMIANPTDIEGLPAVDVHAELAVVGDALDKTQLLRFHGGRATLDTLLRAFSEGVDILYLTCHGRMTDGRAYLYLENERRQAHVIDVVALMQRLAAAKIAPPRLIVLASCDSAGTGGDTFRDDGSFFASAAASFIKLGTAAVIGMHGEVAQDTSRTFVNAFFHHLLEHGQVEAATAAARMEIPRQADWWVASLLVAVDDGMLWAGGPPKEFKYWDELLQNLHLQECTAILGSEMLERLSNRQLAEYFAGLLRYPVRPGSSLDLARISQRLKVENSETRPGASLNGFYRRIQTDDGMVINERDLAKSVLAWGKKTFDSSDNVYCELADLPIPLFITTNPDDLLTEALQRREKSPQVLVCPWKDDEPGHRDTSRGFKPTVDEPVVYHLFGHLSDPQSVVLTEDDFFDHLIWIARHGARTIPPAIPAQLARTSLLFLGFQLEDWEFRVLLRSLVKMQMVEMLVGHVHVAVQLDPRELSPEQQIDAQRALEEHFSKTEVNLAIYWGTVELFLREMKHELKKRGMTTAAADTVRT